MNPNLVSVALLLSAGVCGGQEWVQWRGPNRDGSIANFQAPDRWPEKLNREWQITVGEGHSSPVVSDGRIFLLTRQRGREVVSAIDSSTAAVQWSRAYDPGDYRMTPSGVGHGKGPKSTPLLHDGGLYTLGITGVLSCFDSGSGNLVWRKDFKGRYRRSFPIYGASMSPLVDNGLLIAHVGGDDDGALTAFDPASGNQRWRWTGDGPGYASPIVVELGGVRQVVTLSQENVIGVAAATGELLWLVPFRTPYVQNIVTPVLHGGLLVVSGYTNPTIALRVAQKEGKWSVERVWENRRAEMYMSSPVIANGLLCGFAKRYRGQFFCLDPTNGETRWAGDPRTGDFASILVGDQTLLMLTEHAELTIARVTGSGFEVIRKYTVADSQTWAHPVPLRNGVLIKDRQTLAYWAW